MIPIIAKDTEHLKKLIAQEMKTHGNECDLNHIDISLIGSMYDIFSNSRFNGDISKWNVSNVRIMQNMFAYSIFNGNISHWDTSNVITMDGMFKMSVFNGDISNWNTVNVTNMSTIFWGSQFNGDISQWDVEMVKSMNASFWESQFTQDLSKWKPYKLIQTVNTFEDSLAQRPYWLDYTNEALRTKAIDAYNLYNEIDGKLLNSNKSPLKVKI